MMPHRYRLPSYEVSRVMRYGTRVVGNGMTVIYTSRPIDSRNQLSRFACIVSIKVDKRAVVRNRIKRLLRESTYHILPSLVSSVDCVVIAKRQLLTISQKEIESRLYEVLTA